MRLRKHLRVGPWAKTDSIREVVFMNTISKILGVNIACALICGAGVGAYFGFKYVVRAFNSSKFYVDPITAMAWAVTLLAALIIANSIRRAGQQRGSIHQLKDKSEAYQVFVSLWTALLHTGLGCERRNHPKTEEELKALDGLMVLCASRGVVRSHAALRDLERKYGGQDQRVWAQFAVTLLEIRRDLGLEPFGLKPAEVLQLVLGESGQAHSSSQPVAHQDTQPRVSLEPN